MHDALKLFYFVKNVIAQKEIFLLFYQIAIETLFMKEFKRKIFKRLSNENIVYLAFKFVFNKNQSGWWTTSQSA